MPLPNPLRIGTRKSVLALAQAEMVRGALLRRDRKREIVIVPLSTTGDRTAGPLYDVGGKGLFTKELEDALLSERIDFAVHSLKDVETALAPGLVLAGFLERGDPRDALVTRGGGDLASLPAGARVGTSSPRRSAQLRHARPDLVVVPFRGNVTTRLAKPNSGEVDATVLALAGLVRLGKENEASEILPIADFIPAGGQGTLAIECREDRPDLIALAAAIDHAPTRAASLAERGLVAALGGSCRTPIGAYARIVNGRLLLDALLATPDASVYLTAKGAGDASDSEALGREVAEKLIARGGRACLA